MGTLLSSRRSFSGSSRAPARGKAKRVCRSRKPDRSSSSSAPTLHQPRKSRCSRADVSTVSKRRYRHHRWYDSESGRWISQDPIGFAAGDSNSYRYVGNQQTTKTDPSGLAPPAELPIDLGDGLIIYAVRSSRESLSDELKSNYPARGCTGGFVIPRFFDKGVKTLDDGSIKKDTSIVRKQFLVEYAERKGVPRDGQFHRVTVPGRLRHSG